jgi:hypothetical protein
MICSLSKWFVSNASDKNKTIPKFAQNHLKHCRSCQEFHMLTRDLDLNAAFEAQPLSQEIPASLLDKVNAQPSVSIGQETQSKIRRKLIPILSVSVAIPAVLLFFIFVLLPPKQASSPPLNENFSFLFSRDSIPGGTLQKLATQVNTPFDEEWIRLKNAMQSASRYLTGQLNLKIDPPLNQ